MNKRKKSNPEITSRKTVRLSITKTRKIEKGFSITVKDSRGTYLSEEINKYKNIRVIYD